LEEKRKISVEKKKNTEKGFDHFWATKNPETMLTDPIIWISDTGATVNSTANFVFANNWEPDTSNNVAVRRIIWHKNQQEKEILALT
jgi:hypothetical protein